MINMVCMIDDIISISSRSSTSDRRFKSVMQINMHDGMADHCFQASLLQGIGWAKRISVLMHKVSQVAYAKTALGLMILTLAGR